jgi:cobalamin-dependent methionine synthase I
MLLVGELINASRKAVGEAINSGDSNYIARLAKVQHEAGADYIDVNAALSVKEEPERLVWLVELVQAQTRAPCCIDSPNPEAIAKGLDAALIDPLDKRMMANIVCAESLAGRDEFCQKYLQAFRMGGFDFQ